MRLEHEVQELRAAVNALMDISVQSYGKCVNLERQFLDHIKEDSAQMTLQATSVSDSSVESQRENQELIAERAKCADLEKMLAALRDEIEARNTETNNALMVLNAKCTSLEKERDNAIAKAASLEKELDGARQIIQLWDQPQKHSHSIGFHKFVGRMFILRSLADKSYVIDTDRHHEKGGAIRVAKYSQGSVNQIWTVNNLGHLIPFGNELSRLSAKNPSNNTAPVIISNTGKVDMHNLEYRWILDGYFIRCMKNPQQVLTVKNAEVKEGGEIVTQSCIDRCHYKWEIELIDS